MESRIDKWLVFLLLSVGVLAILMSCGCPNTAPKHKFEIGEDVKIKNKVLHNNATIISQTRGRDCRCLYEITYHSTLGVKRRRTVTEEEIK